MTKLCDAWASAAAWYGRQLPVARWGMALSAAFVVIAALMAAAG